MKIDTVLWRADAVGNFEDGVTPADLAELNVSDKPRTSVEGDDISHDPLIVLMHGFGSNENDLPGLVEALGLDLNWASIRAPKNLADSYEEFAEIAAYQKAFAWFVEPIVESKSELQTFADENSAAILEWIESEKTTGRIKANQQIIWIGFSQGGAMSLAVLRNEKLRKMTKACVCLSGYLPFDKSFTFDESIEIFHGYGTDDDVVPVNLSRQVDAWLASDASVIKTYLPLGHSISMEEARDVSEFLM
jgi:phospholipase/carboxylesterase